MKINGVVSWLDRHTLGMKLLNYQAVAEDN